jgi:hypothetical protein
LPTCVETLDNCESVTKVAQAQGADQIWIQNPRFEGHLQEIGELMASRTKMQQQRPILANQGKVEPPIATLTFLLSMIGAR